MEILRFDDAETVPARRKKSSRGAIAIGLVATLLGVGTAFASTTITINGGNSVDVGQGVSRVAACDNSIRVLPATTVVDNSPVYKKNGDPVRNNGKNQSAPSFTTAAITFQDVDLTEYDSSTATGCGGEYFAVKIYYDNNSSNSNEVQQQFSCGKLGLNGSQNELNPSSGPAIEIVKCVSPGTLVFRVPTTGNDNDSFTIPLGRNWVNGDERLLDITYFTIMSSSTDPSI